MFLSNIGRCMQYMLWRHSRLLFSQCFLFTGWKQQSVKLSILYHEYNPVIHGLNWNKRSSPGSYVYINGLWTVARDDAINPTQEFCLLDPVFHNVKTAEHLLARLVIYIVRGFHPSQSKHWTSQSIGRFQTLWQTSSKSTVT